jgi:hypothetical protein
MGREDKRLRARIARQLAKRLRRKPTEEELEKAIADVRQTRRKSSRRDRAREPRTTG